MKMLEYDPFHHTVKEIEVYSLEIKEGLYLSTEKGMEVAAYVYPLDKKEELLKLDTELKAAEQLLEETRGEIFNVKLPKLRTWDKRFNR